MTTIAGNGVAGYNGEGLVGTLSHLNRPVGLSLDGDSLLIVNHWGHRISKLDLVTGVLISIAGSGVAGFSGDGGPATNAHLNQPYATATDRSGIIYLTDQENHRVRMISLSGVISTVAGGDGSLGAVRGIIISGGRMLVTDISSQSIVQVSGAVRELPPPSPTPYCSPSFFRALPRMDLVGTLVGTALTPGALSLMTSPDACRQACCDAPACDGFSFASGDASFVSGGTASSFLYVNITQLIPNSGYSSGIYESTL